jgi:hypothetical protein
VLITHNQDNFMKYFFMTLVLSAISAVAAASTIHCESKGVVYQVAHESYDYTTDYSVDGTIEGDVAHLKIISREYSLKKEGGRWVTDYSKKGNVHTDIDQRSSFKVVSKTDKNTVYVTSYATDRTGAYQYNLKFVLENKALAGTEVNRASYYKTSQTDDMPYKEVIPMNCLITK